MSKGCKLSKFSIKIIFILLFLLSSKLTVKTAIAAIYEGNKLKYVSAFSDEETNMLKAEFLNVTLDDNKKYAMVNMLTFNEKTYVYLAELDDFNNYIIGEILNDEIIQVEDQNLLGQLIIEFSKLD